MTDCRSSSKWKLTKGDEKSLSAQKVLSGLGPGKITILLVEPKLQRIAHMNYYEMYYFYLLMNYKVARCLYEFWLHEVVFCERVALYLRAVNPVWSL